MAETTAKKGTDLTWAWALAAVIAVLALMAWLFVNRPAETAVVTSEEAAESVQEAAAAPAAPVELASVANALQEHEGRTVRVADVPVTVVLGPRAFWADVPGGSPLFVAVDGSVTDASWVSEGSTSTLEGTIKPVTEADLDQLVQDQALLPEGRLQAAIATHYFHVTGIEE